METLRIIKLGRDQVSMMDPPNDGQILEGGKVWNIGRNCYGMIVLRSSGEVHPDFLEGMDILSFCSWINERC